VVQPVTLMKHFSCTKSSWQSLQLLLLVCVAGVFLTGADAGSGDSRARFVQLDSEIQAIKEEILEINRDILQIEEMSLYPQGQQLIVLVSVADNSPLEQGTVSLQLDGQMVSQYQYSASEYATMREGGVHRLYSGRVADGQHQMQISVVGKQTKGDAFSEQRNVTFTKQRGRKYMELHLGPQADVKQPGLTIREW